MSTNHLGGNIQNAITVEEHQGAINAKRVAIVDASGAQITSFGTSGTLSSNTTTPGANNIGVLPGVANATYPTYIEGNQVLLSTDLFGNNRSYLSTTLDSTNDSITTYFGVLVNLADGLSAASTVPTISYPVLYNNSTFDRTRSAINATNSTGTGIMATGILAQLDDTSPTAISENQFGNLRMTADRSVLISPRATTPVQTSISSATANATILILNNSRKGATVFNESSAILYLKLGTTASISSYSAQVAANSYYEVPFGYIGEIDGIWAAVNGNARITELT